MPAARIIGSSIAVEVERVRQIAHRHIAVRDECFIADLEAGQLFEREAARDEAQDRSRIVLRVIDVVLLRERRNDDRGNPGRGAEAVAFRRGRVIPEVLHFICARTSTIC